MRCARCGARSGVALWMALLATAGFRAGGGAARQDRRRRHRLDDRGDRPRADDEHPGARAVLLPAWCARRTCSPPWRRRWPRSALGSILWVVIGYSLAFTGEGPAIGTLERVLLRGMDMNAISPLAKTIPESVFMIYQMTFAVITVALVAGSVADRMRFSAFLWFVAAAGCCSSMCRSRIGCGAAASSAAAGVLDFAGGTVVHLNAGIAGLVAVLSARRAARLRHRQSRALRSVARRDRHRPALGRLVRLQRRLGARRQLARRLRHRRDASRGLRRRAHLDGCWSGGTAASRRCSA